MFPAGGFVWHNWTRHGNGIRFDWIFPGLSSVLMGPVSSFFFQFELRSSRAFLAPSAADGHRIAPTLRNCSPGAFLLFCFLFFFIRLLLDRFRRSGEKNSLETALTGSSFPNKKKLPSLSFGSSSVSTFFVLRDLNKKK